MHLTLEGAISMSCIKTMAIPILSVFLFDKKFGYSTDVVGMDDDVFDKLTGIDLWIVEALRASRTSHIVIMNKLLTG